MAALGRARVLPAGSCRTLGRVDTSVVVSIVAVLVAAGSLVVALRADRRAGRAEARGFRAQLVVEPSGSGGAPTGEPGVRRFDVTVRNVGLGVARGVRVWLEDESGRAVSSRSAGNAVTIAPGEEPVRLSLTVAEASLPPPPVSFSVWIAWSDEAGRHEREHAGVTVST
jgi:hypothetical protein